ncbi:hypothetical protein C7B70_20135 [Chlorogloea sp. CCALA 695]|nr:hypothetical protein C7B70_20135 [Chlorogloea sp. CCALA 695]
MKHSPHNCQVIQLISEAEATASFDAGAKLIEVRASAAPELEVLVDRHLIISALSNLVQNAIKFTKLGWIVVATRYYNRFDPKSSRF